jgi:hypothetical protein
VRNWHGTIRAIEEFINLPLFGLKDQDLRDWLCSVPLDDRYWSNPPAITRAVQEKLFPLFERDVVQRFTLTMMQTAAIAHGFRIHGQTAFRPDITLDTIGEALNYFQSRRRHLVSLLYTMPFACHGTEVLESLDTLNILLPLVEHCCVSITGFHLKLAQLDALANLGVLVDDMRAPEQIRPQSAAQAAVCGGVKGIRDQHATRVLM